MTDKLDVPLSLLRILIGDVNYELAGKPMEDTDTVQVSSTCYDELAALSSRPKLYKEFKPAPAESKSVVKSMQGQGVVEYTSILFLLAILAIAVLAVFGPALSKMMVDNAPAAAQSIDNTYEWIQNSEHSIVGHLNQAFNADLIEENIRFGKCKDMRVFICTSPEYPQRLYIMCGTPRSGSIIKDFFDMFVGAVVYRNAPDLGVGETQRLTGFAARGSYWKGKIGQQNCTRVTDAPSEIQ